MPSTTFEKFEPGIERKNSLLVMHKTIPLDSRMFLLLRVIYIHQKEKAENQQRTTYFKNNI